MPNARAILVALAVWTPSVVGAQGEPVLLAGGFATGNSYREASEDGKWSYVSGVIDGMLFSPALGAPRTKVEWLESCTRGMTNEQVTAIVNRFLAAHPERWHQPMHGLVFAAMKQACPKGG